MPKLTRIVAEALCYHTVSVTRGREPFLADAANSIILQEAITYQRTQAKAYVFAYAILPDHFHLLVAPRDGRTVSDILLDIKRFSAKAINRRLGRTGPLWQQSFFDRAIRNEKHLAATIEYIHRNPVEEGLVSQPEQYKFSSAYAANGNDLEAYLSG